MTSFLLVVQDSDIHCRQVASYGDDTRPIMMLSILVSSISKLLQRKMTKRVVDEGHKVITVFPSIERTLTPHNIYSSILIVLYASLS
jgi:isocitrate dehydrogenase kinase/phosphatase